MTSTGAACVIFSYALLSRQHLTKYVVSQYSAVVLSRDTSPYITLINTKLYIPYHHNTPQHPTTTTPYHPTTIPYHNNLPQYPTTTTPYYITLPQQSTTTTTHHNTPPHYPTTILYHHKTPPQYPTTTLYHSTLSQ